MVYTDMTCSEFAEVLSSKAPVPGGGGASALVGALGAALGSMVGNLTVGKKKYADVEEDVKALMEQAEALRLELLDLVEADAKAFEPLSKAYGIPKDDPTRPATLEQCLHDAAKPPLDIMKAACKCIALMKDFAEKGSTLAISDAGCGALFCRAALLAADLNVRVNTRLMTDREYAEQLNAECDTMIEQYAGLADQVYRSVEERLQ